MDPKEQLLQKLATSLLRDFFAAAALAGMYSNRQDLPADEITAREAYAQADTLLDRSYTPEIIKQLSTLKP